MLGIVNYGVGNIKAFANIYHRLGIKHFIINNLQELAQATHLILPGVGSFDYAMSKLNSSGMVDALHTMVLEKHVPVLGICVGMQMLAKSSDEGELPGLGWLNATVNKFALTDISLPLPHMGWNTLRQIKQCPLFKDMPADPRFYFLHSYYMHCVNHEDVIATANYDSDFSCVVQHNNIFGIQCHPEKSHGAGVQLLKNFGEL